VSPPPPKAPAPKANWRVALGARAWREGHAAEWAAAALLMLKGYRILGFRLKTPAGEIDLLAQRGRVLAVVEVKRRATLEAALASLSSRQRARLVAAGQAVARHRRSLAGLDVRLDMVALAPRRFPRHVCGLSQDEPRGP
jgi:putative endonuclease